MTLDLNEIDIDEVQEAMFRRRPGRYREPYIIDRVVYVKGKSSILYPKTKDIIKIYSYENELHEKSGRGFQPPPEEVPLDEFKQIKRYIELKKLGI